MARRGTLPKGVKLEPFLKNGITPRCQFVKNATNEQCKKSCVTGRPRCRNHGGHAGRPPIHGRNATYPVVPPDLFKNFERAKSDPDLLSLRNEVALLNSQLWTYVEDISNKRSKFSDAEIKRVIWYIGKQKDLVTAEHKRLVDMEQMVSSERLLLLITSLVDIIYKNVSDGHTRKVISEQIRLLIGGATLQTSFQSNSVIDGTFEVHNNSENGK
jgi:hypothetical protein